MEILKEKYSITELSEILQLTDHALRYYEKEFGLCVPKDSRGRRYYTTELANIMFQIKTMRSEGLEIKAIKNILQADSSDREPPPVVDEGGSGAMVSSDRQYGVINEIHSFFKEFREQLTGELANELTGTRDYIQKEITKSKMELGACVENGMRRLEAKMERHFLEVDHALGVWREKNRKGIFKNLLTKTIK